MKKKVLDITDYKCPMTFLKTKEFIKLNINNKKIIIIKGKKDLELLTNSLRKNFELKVIQKNDDIFEIELI
tara:strand:+ start:155 stop:367 length:213 start_codon:yes stop_codon:yes gene_type:complete